MSHKHKTRIGRGTRRWLASAAVFSAVLLTPGCGRETASIEPPARDPAVKLDSPLNATRSLLDLLSAHIHAVADHDRSAADAARDQVVWHVADRADIQTRYEHFSNILANTEAKQAQLWREHVESWAAIVSSYVDGLELDRAVATKGSNDATVRVPAHRGEDAATLLVECARTASNTWQVQKILFEPRRASTAHSRPATQPAQRGDS
jgi:hypothetical protein